MRAEEPYLHGRAQGPHFQDFRVCVWFLIINASLVWINKHLLCGSVWDERYNNSSLDCSQIACLFRGGFVDGSYDLIIIIRYYA